MSSINKVIVVGRVGRDAEVRYAGNGNAVANLSVATSESWTDKGSGEKREETEWHRVVLFGKSAEIAGRYATKGALVGVEGKLKTKKWTDKDGVEKYTTEILADRLQLLGGGAREDRSNDRPAEPQRKPTQSVEDMSDDIPF